MKSTIVIAAHGSWGVGPELDIPPRRVPVRGSDLFAFKTHFANCSLPPDLMPVLGFPGGYGGMVTSDNQRVSLSCCIRRDQLQRLRSGNSSIPAVETVVNHIRRSCSEVDRVLAGATPCSPGLVIGPIRPGIRKSFQPGFFLTGNAAGEAHPIVAEGISMALQSSWLLCRRLIAAQGQSRTAVDLVHVGDEVEREWRREFGPRLRMAALFARLASNPVASALSVRLLHRFPALLEWGARSSGKVRQIVPLAAAAN